MSCRVTILDTQPSRYTIHLTLCSVNSIERNLDLNPIQRFNQRAILNKRKIVQGDVFQKFVVFGCTWGQEQLQSNKQSWRNKKKTKIDRQKSYHTLIVAKSDHMLYVNCLLQLLLFDEHSCVNSIFFFSKRAKRSTHSKS